MVVSEFGKLIRKLRIDKDASMREMAEAMHKSTSYISAIELKKKKVSSQLLEQIIDYFQLDEKIADEIKIAADKSNGQLKLSIDTMSKEDQDGVFAFARKLRIWLGITKPYLEIIAYCPDEKNAEMIFDAIKEYQLKPGECTCGSKKYGRHHRPQDHSGWSPE